MTIEWEDYRRRRDEAFAAVQAVIGDRPVQVRTAGDLATLMLRLPSDTEVVVAPVIRVDERLRLGEQPHRTAVLAELIPVGDPEVRVDLVDDGEYRQEVDITPAVQLVAVVVAHDATGAPLVSVPLKPYERGVEAFADGDLGMVLDADVEMLTWMADTLARTRAPAAGELYDDVGDDEALDDDDFDRIPVDDAELRERLSVEAERLRQAAARLDALRGRHAVTEAAADIVDAADQRSAPPSPEQHPDQQ